MRRLLAWLACAVGAAWLLRRLRRRSPEPVDDPAEELRRKLDETRAPSDAEPEPEPPPAPEAGIDERRRAVHERARSALDDMRGTGADPE
jgi:hypothetical protein